MKAGLTPFGRQCREFRTRYGYTMADQAKGLSLSISYISLIERGQRPFPEDYVEKVAYWLSLSAPEKNKLIDAIRDAGDVCLAPNEISSERAAIEHEYVGALNILPTHELEQLRELFSKPPPQTYSETEIRKQAALARALFNSGGRASVDILSVVENYIALVDPSFSLQVEPDSSFRAVYEAYAASNGEKIDRVVVSERIYTTASQQNPYSRYQLAHEFAHWILHRRDTYAFFRLNRKIIKSKNSARQEYEADLFAREFMLPSELVGRSSTPEKLARLSELPLSVAKIRFRELDSVINKGSRDRITVGFAELRATLAGKSIPQALHETSKSLSSPSIEPAQVIPFPGYATTRETLFSRRLKLRKKVGLGMDLFEFADAQEEVRRSQGVDRQIADTVPCDRARQWFDENGWR